MLCCWLRPTKPQTALTPSSTAASKTRSMKSSFFLRIGRIVVQQVVEVADVGNPDAGGLHRGVHALGALLVERLAADPACWPPDPASPRAARRFPSDAAPPTAGWRSAPSSRANSSHSSIARSGSRSRTSRGRQLLERRGEDAHLHELRIEGLDTHRLNDLTRAPRAARIRGS